jgi:CRISPR-associated protein Csc2
VHNHLLAVVFSNGEIFSNLRFTQAVYDTLQGKNQWSEPLDRDNVLRAGLEAYNILMGIEPVAKQKEWTGANLQELVDDVTALYQDEKRTGELITKLNKATVAYAKVSGNTGPEEEA